MLVSFYKDGCTNVRLHDDNEDSLDATQPIFVVSLGAVRQIEFVDKARDTYYCSDLILQPQHASIYVMKAGCQEYFLHRVRKNKSIKGDRISLSFRCFKPKQGQVSVASNSPITKTHGYASASTPIISKCDRRPCVSVPESTPATPDGYAPFPGKKRVSFNWSSSTSFSNPALSHSPSKPSEKICILFGSSITQGVDGSRMSRGNRTVINLSSSGYFIRDVAQEAEEFVSENPYVVSKVDKVIINVGTNDIKWFNCFERSVTKQFWPPLVKLVNIIKNCFPYAQIIFHSVLPIQAIYKYTATAIHRFNHLLIEICERFGCVFFDNFDDFLDDSRYDINRYLYNGRLHLNDNGLKLLCRAIKFIIYNNVFNPYARSPYTPYYYM